jgi:hypothetical protein
MEIDLYPVICWLNRDPDLSYKESVGAALVSLNSHGEMLIRRRGAARHESYSPSDLILDALGSLQHKILDQYLPALDERKPGALAHVWPWWASIVYRLSDGKQGRLTRLPKDDKVPGQVPCEGGTCTFTFYRNDDLPQRERWVKHFMDEKLKQKLERLRAHVEQEPEGAEWHPSVPPVDHASAEYLERLKELVDSDDFAAALAAADDNPGELRGEERKRANAARRQQRCRKKPILFMADLLLHRNDEMSRRFREIIKNTRDGRRSDMLLRLVTRAAEQSSQAPEAIAAASD